MGLNLPNPYSYFLTPHGTYQFETIDKSTYHVTFRYRNDYFPNNPFLEDHIFLLGFDTHIRPRKFDSRIEDTLIKIISEFFEKNSDCGLIFECSTSENLHRARKITFSKWFKKHNTSFEKHDFRIPGGDFEYHASLIVHQENPYKETMLEECKKFVSEVSK